MNPLYTQSGIRLAALVKSGEATSRELVEAHIRRIESVNPWMNVVVADRFFEAREEADRADRAVRIGHPDARRQLHGVPCTIKESFALTGMPNTSGLVARQGIVATEDAPTVHRLRRAGAIPMGVTNVSELCMWMESFNKVYGRSNNPYDPRRIVGGSSGGEGAIVGAGGSPFGLGADIGGSIRLPAFFNGVFGHKPTGGMVPATGQHPIAANEALRYMCTGPITRRAEDLMPLLRILAGPDPGDSECRHWDLGNPGSVTIEGMDVLVVRDNGLLPVKADLLEAQDKCAAYLASRGARVRQARFDDLRHSILVWAAMVMGAGGATYSEMLGNGKPIHLAREMLIMLTGCSPYTIPSLFLAAIEEAGKHHPDDLKPYEEVGRQLRAELCDAIGHNGIMLYPSYTEPAPLHNKPLMPPFQWVYTGIINVMEMPATQIPLGLNRDGLPLGVQAITTHGNDHVSIAVAMELEKAFGGWVPPRGLP